MKGTEIIHFVTTVEFSKMDAASNEMLVCGKTVKYGNGNIIIARDKAHGERRFAATPQFVPSCDRIHLSSFPLGYIRSLFM